MNRLHIALQLSQCFQRKLLRAANNNVTAPLAKRQLSICDGVQQKFGTNKNPTKQTNAKAALETDAPKKHAKVSPKITLLAQNDAISVTTLDEAQKLAKRRDLRLSLIQELDTKTQRPVYKLVKAADIITQELAELQLTDQTTAGEKDKNAHRKSDKSLTIGARISEHDLASRVKNIVKWLQKRHEVRILIQTNAADASSSDNTVKTIEKAIKEPEVIGKIVQRHTKGAVIKFNIVPVSVQQTNTPA